MHAFRTTSPYSTLQETGLVPYFVSGLGIYVEVKLFHKEAYRGEYKKHILYFIYYLFNQTFIYLLRFSYSQGFELSRVQKY